MNVTKKNTVLLIIAFLVMILSLTMSIYSLSNSSDKGVAQENTIISSCSITNIRDFNNSLNTSIFLKEPVIVNNSIVYGLSLKEKGAHNQFYFTLVNNGNKELKIGKIKIEGLDNYEKNVKVHLVGINENDLFPPYSEINVKVTTDYEEETSGEDKEIDINNIKISIESFLYIFLSWNKKKVS